MRKGLIGFAWLCCVWACVRVHPHHLVFFNAASADSDNGHWHLLDANVEWGPANLAVNHWQDERHQEVGVRRWLAAKRQRMRRERPEVRENRAAIAREARERKSRLKTDPPAPTEPIMPAEQPDPPGAWSRSRKIPGPICDRVGCCGSPRLACRCPARYYSHACRDAMQRVRDRERKWLWQNTLVGQIKCRLQAAPTVTVAS